MSTRKSWVNNTVLLVQVNLSFIIRMSLFLRYLEMLGKENEARKSIRFYHSCDALTVDKVINEIKLNLKLQAKSMPIMDILKDEKTRTGIITGCVISAATSFSGNPSN